MDSDIQSTESVATAETGEEPLISLPAGRLIAGRYEVQHELGRGGYGIVYVVRDLTLQTDVALKALRPDRNTAAALNRLRREARAARAISNPRIVRIYDIGGDDDLTYLTMEWVKGESLRDRLLRGRLSIGETIDFILGILEGLETLHAAGIVHRDLKPANVLLDEDGHPKLADFGLVRFLDGEEEGTASRAGVGTEGYRAPEQALGYKLDGRADLYSGGVMLFEMLAGQRPFSPDGTSNRIMVEAPDVRSLRREVPLWLAMMVSRLLAREPGDRYPTANAVILSLRARRIDVRIVRLDQPHQQTPRDDLVHLAQEPLTPRQLPLVLPRQPRECLLLAHALDLFNQRSIASCAKATCAEVP